jgi:hypothetical protein
MSAETTGVGRKFYRGVILIALFAIGFTGGYFYGFDQGEELYKQPLTGSALPGDRRLDDVTGCAAIAAGVRAIVDGKPTPSPEVRAVLLDQLLLNYRNMECGVVDRTRLLLSIVEGRSIPSPQPGSAAPPAPPP